MDCQVSIFTIILFFLKKDTEKSFQILKNLIDNYIGAVYIGAVYIVAA